MQGYIPSNYDYSTPNVEIDIDKGIGGVETLYHYPNRLFDRDSVYTYYYKINYFYVLFNYANVRSNQIQKFRRLLREQIRSNFVSYLTEQCNITFYKKEFDNLDNLESFIKSYFKVLNGKIYRTDSEQLTLILATTLEFYN